MPPIGNVTCQPNNVTTGDPSNIGKDDLNALLYIVVTLLFYSMGIIIGIITYLKREQADMEEDKMFDMYMQLKREPFNLYKKERVQQMALYLKQLEEQAAAREKIENWKTIEHNQMQAHLQRYQNCRRHAHRHFSCPDCNKTSPIAEICQGYDERSALDAGWVENGGGTALLCSLTLGVCEPLLTPDSMKRLALTELANVEGRSLNSSSHGVSILQSYPCMPSKTAFRHGSLTVHYAENDKALLRDNSGNELKLPLAKSQPSETNLDSPSMFEKCDMELKELRQFKYEDVKAVFQKNPALDENNCDVCDNITFNAQIMPSLNKRSASLTTKSGKCSTIFRQLSQDLDLKSCDLAVHSSLGKNYNLHVDKHNENMTTSVDNPLDASEATQDIDKCVASRYGLDENRSHSDVRGADACDNVLPLQRDPKERCQDQEQHCPQQLPHQDASPTVVSVTEACHPPQKYELPLHLFVLAQQPSQSSDVRPKVFVPMPLIPHTCLKDEAVNPCTNSPINTSPQTTPRIHSPVHDSGKPGNSKNVDISGVTRARQLGLNWKSKTVEKKGAPRTQPERRGALFFTQRSLHKDIDSPKSVSGRKHSRPAVFGRQESFDSHNSRTSEMPESLENPLLHRICNIDSAMNLSSPSLSVGSNSVSPPAVGKHAKRIPRLIRSQTVDTSKLLQQSNPF